MDIKEPWIWRANYNLYTDLQLSGKVGAPKHHVVQGSTVCGFRCRHDGRCGEHFRKLSFDCFNLFSEVESKGIS